MSKKLKVLAILENAVLSKLAKEKSISIKDNISEDQWNQLITSINELNEETKNVLLKSLPYELIKDFPKELKENAINLRKDFCDINENKEYSSINQQDVNSINIDDIFENTDEYGQIPQANEEKYLFETFEKNENLETIFSDFNFYDELPEIDEDTFIFFMNCLMEINSALNPENHKQMSKLLKSFMLIPKTAYKILDFLIFSLTFQEAEDSDALIDQKEVKQSKLCKIFLDSGVHYFKSSIITLLHFFCEKKVMLPILVNAITFDFLPLIFENSTFKQFDSVKELRDILTKSKIKKIASKQETIFEILAQKKSDFNFIETLKDSIFYKDDIENKFVRYPKIVANVPKNVIANIYSSKIDFRKLDKKFEILASLMDIKGLISFTLNMLHLKIEKWSKSYNSKKEKIIDYKKRNGFSKDVASMEDLNERKDHWNSLKTIAEEDIFSLQDLRRDSKKILRKLRLAINKYANNKSREIINKSLNKEKPESFEEKRKEIFYEVIAEVLGQIHEKINQDETILLFFKEYFECCFVIMDVVGTEFSFDDFENNYNARRIYTDNRSVFKMFIDFYKFLNPLEDKHAKKKKELSKKITHEEEKLEKKITFDLCLENILFGMSYGKYAYFFEIIFQYKIMYKISDVYHYYIKKSPDEHSLTSNLKFLYLR